MEIYRTQVRLYMDDPKEAEIVKKIKERNKVLHKSINDYFQESTRIFWDCWESDGNAGLKCRRKKS